MTHDPIFDTLLMIGLLSLIFAIFAIAATLIERVLMARAASQRRALLAAQASSLVARERAARRQL